MNIIQESIQSLLPSGAKRSSSGWISINAPCCHHRGETKDKRKRGGLLIKDDGFVWHCFNCGYSAGWQPGKTINQNTRNLFKWLGLDDETVGKLVIESMKISENLPTNKISTIDLTLKEEQLPPESRSLVDWITQGNETQDLINCIEYIYDRGLSIKDYNWHWSPTPGYEDRILIPFYHDQKVVGWAARKLSKGKPKYLSSSQPSYVFNLDSQIKKKKKIIITEGPFDAIAIDGVAILSNNISHSQLLRLKSTGLPIILVPDRDSTGIKLIKTALDNSWSVSVPPWEDDIKDVSDAVKKYGKIYTLWSILNHCESNQLKIQLNLKKLEKKYNVKN